MRPTGEFVLFLFTPSEPLFSDSSRGPPPSPTCASQESAPPMSLTSTMPCPRTPPQTSQLGLNVHENGSPQAPKTAPLADHTRQLSTSSSHDPAHLLQPFRWHAGSVITTTPPLHPLFSSTWCFLVSCRYPVYATRDTRWSARTTHAIQAADAGEMNCERQRPNSGSPPLSMLSYRRSWSLTVP